jgi:1-acyl-sn-glycerol-3-phosphate acyltransferase
MSALTSLGLRAAGWLAEGAPPAIPKYVCLGVPHTSNWDGVVLLAMADALGLDMSWMIKGSWFKGPLAPLLRRLGAVEVDRGASKNLVGQMIAEFDRRERFVLVIPPEGTRARAEHWRSGFYHIAHGAKVPVVPAYMDYGRKRIGFGEPIHLTGDVRADMDRIRAFYQARDPRGFAHDNFGPIRLKEEV